MNARTSSDSDGSTSEEQQLHNNLTLLELSGVGCKTAPAGVELNRFTFRKPSSRTLEHVLYHLYAIVVGEGVAQKVSCLLPVHGDMASGWSPCITASGISPPPFVGIQEFLPRDGC